MYNREALSSICVTKFPPKSAGAFSRHGKQGSSCTTYLRFKHSFAQFNTTATAQEEVEENLQKMV